MALKKGAIIGLSIIILVLLPSYPKGMASNESVAILYRDKAIAYVLNNYNELSGISAPTKFSLSYESPPYQVVFTASGWKIDVIKPWRIPTEVEITYDNGASFSWKGQILPTGTVYELEFSYSNIASESSSNDKPVLGVWMAPEGLNIPTEAEYVVIMHPNYLPTGYNLILNWYSAHRPWGPFNPFRTEADLKNVERKYRELNTDNLWGITFLGEEHYRKHIQFNDDVDITWFGRRLVGYPIFLRNNPGASMDEWRDMMYLRMVKGFYQYFHRRDLKVGITLHAGTITPNWRGKENRVVPDFHYGKKAYEYFQSDYDFIVSYAYTTDLQDFEDNTLRTFQILDRDFDSKTKIWVLSRRWEDKIVDWKPEAITYETRECFKRGMIVTYYASANPDPLFEEVWAYLTKQIARYHDDPSYKPRFFT